MGQHPLQGELCVYSSSGFLGLPGKLIKHAALHEVWPQLPWFVLQYCGLGTRAIG